MASFFFFFSIHVMPGYSEHVSTRKDRNNARLDFSRRKKERNYETVYGRVLCEFYTHFYKVHDAGLAVRIRYETAPELLLIAYNAFDTQIQKRKKTNDSLYHFILYGELMYQALSLCWALCHMGTVVSHSSDRKLA